MARILVVDDNAEIQMLLVALLQRAGHDVIEAADGIHVETEIHDTNPDLIILDLMMPILDGWSTLEQLKSKPSTSKLPVIITSALDGPDLLSKARNMGAADYVPKPFQADEIISRINWALSASEQAA